MPLALVNFRNLSYVKFLFLKKSWKHRISDTILENKEILDSVLHEERRTAMFGNGLSSWQSPILNLLSRDNFLKEINGDLCCQMDMVLPTLMARFTK